MYMCDAVAGPLHGALLRNAWLDSEYMFCDSSGCVGCIAFFFYVKGNSDLEVVSVLLSWLGLRATLNGEVCTVEFSVAFRGWWSHLESGQYFSEPFVCFCSSAFAGQVLLEEFGRFFGSPR